jgi:hypothetical protein
VKIVIPTYGRVNKQTTLMALPLAIRREVLLVASNASEASALKTNYGLATNQVKVAPVKTIVDKRQWILENIKDDVFMMDDDMDFYRRCPAKKREFRDGRWRPNPGFMTMSKSYGTEVELISVFDKLRSYLDDYGAVGISSRMGNDLEPKEWRLGSNRLMHAFGYHRRALLKQDFKFNAVQFREDMHMALTLLRAGHPSIQCYEWCVAPGSYGAPGGCSDERTVAKSDAAAEVLVALHPGFVRVVQKDYKGTPRKEVVVSWKKALESSIK